MSSQSVKCKPMPTERKQQNTNLRQGKFGMKRYNQMSDVLCKITFEYNGPWRRRAGEEIAVFEG